MAKRPIGALSLAISSRYWSTVVVGARGEDAGGLASSPAVRIRPGLMRVDPDVVGDELVGQALGEHHQGGLGGVVDRLVAQRLLGADRGVVEDDAAAALLHRRAPGRGERRTAAITCRSQ